MPLTNAVAILDLETKRESVLLVRKGLTIHLYGWQNDNGLIVEIPPQQLQNNKLPTVTSFFRLTLDGSLSPITGLDKLPFPVPGSAYPRTSFDQRWIAYESSGGTIVVSIEQNTFQSITGARRPIWLKEGLVVELDDQRMLFPNYSGS